MSKTVLADTGFWFALFDPREPDHERVGALSDLLESLALVVPWPILYETLRTRFVRRRDWMAGLETRLKRPNVVFLDDRHYCEEAYSLSVDYSTRLGRPISMVDMLCRLLIADSGVRIDYLLTTNPRDFRDVCLRHGVEML